MNRFFSRFHFNPQQAGGIIVERSRFLARGENFFALAPEFFARVQLPWLRPTFSASQVVDSVFWPFTAATDQWHNDQCQLGRLLQFNDSVLKEVAAERGLQTWFEIHGSAAPAVVHPWERYQRWARQMSEQAVRAACNLISTRVQVLMPDLATALLVYNAAAEQFPELFRLWGDLRDSNWLSFLEGSINWQPPIYQSPEHFATVAVEQHFASDSADCQHLIRLSTRGAVEFRLLRLIPDYSSTCYQVKQVYDFCHQVTAGLLPERPDVPSPQVGNGSW